MRVTSQKDLWRTSRFCNRGAIVLNYAAFQEARMDRRREKSYPSHDLYVNFRVLGELMRRKTGEISREKIMEGSVLSRETRP